jgi:drug/metabolite transporter (DMT)-like permease
VAARAAHHSHAAVASRAIAAVAAAVVLWSLSALFVRAGHADALVFTTYRAWLAVPVLWAIVRLRARHHARTGTIVPGRPRPPGATRGARLALVAGAGALFAFSASTGFAAIGSTTVLNVTLIGALQPVLVIAAAVAFLGEHTTRAHVVRAAIALAGTTIVVAASSGGGTWSLAGDVLAVISLVGNSAWYLYGRWIRHRFAVDPVGFMAGVLTAVGLILTPIALIVHGSLGLPAPAIGFAALTMASGTAAHLLSIWAHRYVPASVSSPLLLAEPVLVGAAAWVCFGEALTAVQVVGSFLVRGVLVGMVRSPAHEHVDEETADEMPPA